MCISIIIISFFLSRPDRPQQSSIKSLQSEAPAQIAADKTNLKSLTVSSLISPTSAPIPARSGTGARGPPAAAVIRCSGDVETAYARRPGGDDAQWCREAFKRHSIVLGRSFGSLPKSDIKRWESSHCGEVIALGHAQSCTERLGWPALEAWAAKRLEIDTRGGTSSISCGSNVKSSTFCRFRNASVDFSRVHISGKSRSFDPGFLHLSLQNRPQPSVTGIVPGFATSTNEPHCTLTEVRPTFFISHDDNFNFGHHMNDVMTLWTMISLSGRSSQASVLVNMDGLREGGPGGSGHRLMIENDPDNLGPFAEYYYYWFGEGGVVRAKDYGTSKVCYDEVYFQPAPGLAYIWQDWFVVSACSEIGPSPLFQSFHFDIARGYRGRHGAASLRPPALQQGGEVPVILQVRSTKKGSASSSARIIANAWEFIQDVNSNLPVNVTAVNYEKLDFKTQISATHSASILIGMHGAGVVHMAHMAIGQPNCCALIEIFPNNRKLGFNEIQGYGNMARHLGIHYFRHVVSTPSTESGSNLDIEAIRDLLQKAVQAVKTQPTCVHSSTQTDDSSRVRSVL